MVQQARSTGRAFFIGRTAGKAGQTCSRGGGRIRPPAAEYERSE